MRARLTVLAACAATALGLTSAGLAADDPYTAMLAPSGTCGPTADQLGLEPAAAQIAMQCLTNYARAQAGLAPLQLNAQLNDAGTAKLAKDVSCGEFSHTPCGQPFSAVFGDYLKGAARYEIGENIAWGTGKYGTPREAMNGWLHSAGHRENILAAGYTELGVGYLPDQTFLGYSGATLWSQQFGTATRSAGQAPSADKKPPTVKKKPTRRSKHRSFTGLP
jgi:uncharacterized protein YkwD